MSKFFRALPEFKGKRRLGRLLFKNKINEARDIEITGKMGCRYSLPNIRENVAFSIFINGIYEEDTFRFLRDTVPPDALFLDLGMNIGSISIPLCKARPDIKVVGIEASPWVMGYLVKNISVNSLDNRITPHNYALFDEDDQELKFLSPKDHFGQGSLSLHNSSEDVILVHSIKLDTFLQKNKIQKVGFIKIDIEGYEYFAFKGGLELLKGPDAPDILFESSDRNEKLAGVEPGGSQKILRDAGYKIYKIEDGKKVLQHDILTTGFYMLFASKK
ncbi:FkbM family methyltransferase [Pollutibacter soli]|uniref:FkbM family methyltransferase n=1 Tax=Pollutibacter soli TaxID=3034157 RepID=UPI003013A341